MDLLAPIPRDESASLVVPDLNLRGSVSGIGWRPPEDLTFEEWVDAGLELGDPKYRLSWVIGDWWRFGDRYGERVEIVKNGPWKGVKYKTCRNLGSVASKFANVSRRRDTLTFEHHAEVAALQEDRADALLDEAEVRQWTVKRLRSEVSRQRNRYGNQPSHDLDTIADLRSLVSSGRKFGTVYADPPWLYDNQGTRAATGNHYEGMTVDELCELPVAQLAADNAHLHMWTTNAFLFDAPKIFDAWGFEFRSAYIWCKPQMGIGNYWRNSHEYLMTAIRGSEARGFNERSLNSWGIFDRAGHSVKPEQIRLMIERASPGPFLEMFGRREVPGWTVWGNEVKPITDDIFSTIAAEAQDAIHEAF